MAKREDTMPDDALDPTDEQTAAELGEQAAEEEPLASPEGEPEETPEGAEEGEEKEPERLNLEVDVQQRGACERHITVTVPREDIERYFGSEFDELMESAEVPGFRKGRVPRRLIEHRFRKEIRDRVKGTLLMDAIAQVGEDQDLSAISEPDIDVEAVEMPDDGPLTFEYDLEVRPEFELPEWKGLTIERPVREFTDADVDARLQNLLTRYGQLVPHEGAAELGDYIVTNLTFKHNDQVLSQAEEEVIRIRPVLSFRDGRIEGFGDLMVGVQAGETRTAEARLTDDAPNEILRGEIIQAVFDVLEVKRAELPELTREFLEDIGDFESEEELRQAVREGLQGQLEYDQRRRVREQITDALTEAANWELPSEMLQRQSRRELERAVLELRRSGFSDEEIRARENDLRQNSRAATARALKEHFILERIAEEEEIDADEDDYTKEIELIARQSGETPRRVRSRLEKGGHMDVLRNQIVEGKVIDLICQHAQFTEVPYQMEEIEAEAVDQAAGGGEARVEIPEAKYDEAPEPLREPEDRT